MLVCRPPPDSPSPPHGVEEMVSINVRIMWTNTWGQQRGKQSLLCWNTVMFVVLILFLKHLVCQIVEINKLKFKTSRELCV